MVFLIRYIAAVMVWVIVILAAVGSIGKRTCLYNAVVLVLMKGGDSRCDGHPLVKEVVTLSFSAKVDLAEF